MKDLGKTKFCLGLQIEHLHSGILVHQSAYVQKILEKFNMDKAHPIKTPMVVRSLDLEKDVFRPREEGERIRISLSQSHRMTRAWIRGPLRQ
jgi:hypothetical protein